MIGSAGQEANLPEDQSAPMAADQGAVTAVPAFWLLGLAAFWVCCNPYFGDNGGSLIYMGRALADLSPMGVGRDIMFLNDGQSGFTIFTPLLRWLTAAFGSPLAMKLAAAGGVIASFASAVVLAQALTLNARLRCAIVAFAGALPAAYGGFQIFLYAEAAATPRPYAEALVLCGLAALATRRHTAAIVLMGLAVVVHPIMALPGVAVLLLWLCMSDRRWILSIVALIVLCGLGIWFNVAPLDRLFTRIDPEWRAILVDRAPHLFPSLWPPGWVGRNLVRTATLLVAASLVTPPVRKLFLSSLLVGLAGLATAYLAGEKFSMLVVLQAQTWRMMWLMFALATAAAAICAVKLWPRGAPARITLLFLALGWAYSNENNGAAALFSLTAIGVHFAFDPKKHVFSERTLQVLMGAGAIAIVIGFVRGELAVHQFASDVPSALRNDALSTYALSYDYTPLAVLVGIWAVTNWPKIPIWFGWLGALAIAGAGFVTWDQRSAMNRYIDQGHASDLVALLATQPGDVYWIDGVRENWWLLDRPHWLSAIQGASAVFSRDLSILHRDRAQRAIDAGLAASNILAPTAALQGPARPTLTRPHVDAFCSQADAPAWIVAPLPGGRQLPADVQAVEWSPGVGKFESVDRGGVTVWTLITRYAVVPCKR